MHFFAKNCDLPLISPQSIGIIGLMSKPEYNRLSQAAEWIRKLNEEIGLPYKTMAEKAGIPYTTLLYVKNRSGSDITSEVFNAIRRLYLELVPEPPDEESKSGPLPVGSLGFRLVTDDEDARRIEITIPGSAREFYEGFEFHGGKVDWLELDEESRSFYENIHSLLLHSIDSLNERFAAGLRELRAARERELRAALEEFEKTFRKRMIGLLGN